MLALLQLALCLATDPPVKDRYPDHEAALNSRLKKGVTPEGNANVLLWKALGPDAAPRRMRPEYFEWLGVPEPPAGGEYFSRTWQFARSHLKLGQDNVRAFEDRADTACKRPWTAAEFPDVAAWLAANEKPLALILEAVQRPHYFDPVTAARTEKGPGEFFELGQPLSNACIGVAQALVARSMRLTAEKQYDEAWRDVLACRRLGRLYARGGGWMDYLVGSRIDWTGANAALSHAHHANLTAAQLRDLLKDLRALPPMPSAGDKFDVGERYAVLQSLLVVRRADIDLDDREPTPEERRAWEKLDWEPSTKFVNERFDRAVAVMRQPTRAARHAAGAELSAAAEKDAVEMRVIEPKGLLGSLTAESLPKRVMMAKTSLRVATALLFAGRLSDAADRAAQVERNLHVAFGLAIYHRENGAYPQTLDVLAPKYLADVPADVFTGRPLVYRRDGVGYLLYSVGPNGKDDGGRDRDDDPACDDVAVRVPPKK